jgi:hypothetical protein
MAKDSLRERLREPVYARAYREYLTSLVRRAQQQKPSAVLRGGSAGRRWPLVASPGSRPA